MTESKDLIIITASCGKNLELSEQFLEKSYKLKINAEILDLTTLEIPLFNPRIHSKDNIPVEIEAIKKKLFEIESHAMKLERMGGIDPLYSGAQITHFSIAKSFFFIASISTGIFSLLWILGLNNGISRVVRSNISELIFSSLLFSRNFSESSRFFPQLAEIIIRSFDSVIN